MRTMKEAASTPGRHDRSEIVRARGPPCPQSRITLHREHGEIGRSTGVPY